VSVDYNKLMVAQPFITGTLPAGLLSQQRNGNMKAANGTTTLAGKRNVLCLGLHGSVINNFLANLSSKVLMVISYMLFKINFFCKICQR
jgi:hypothetical protein